MADQEFKSFAAHFSKTMSPELVKYATDVAFLHSRYLFTRREGNRQFGYCTHCRQEHETNGLRHGQSAICSSCGSECGVRASGKGRSRMIDEVYFVYYEKSLVNPQAITARGLYAVRDYRDDYRNVESMVEVKSYYMFEPGRSVMYERPWLYYSDTKGMSCGQNLNRRKTVSSLSSGTMYHKDCFCSYESIRTAVQGTPFQYSTWESYPSGDMVKFFDLYSKYPCIEYLTKLGMSGLVDAKLNGEKTFGVVNWRATNPLKILKMSKPEMNELRASKVRVDPLLLYLRSVSVKDRSNLSFTDLNRIRIELNGYMSYLQDALKRTTLRRIDAYLSKQHAKQDKRKYYDSKGQLLHTWNDYMNDCTKLGLDTAIDSVKFPANLYQAHQNTIKQIKVKEDKAIRAKIAARSKTLQKLRFEAFGFILRPALDSKELIEEGKALQHCVGTYASRYARGETDIFVLRRTDEADKPFYTMEIQNGSIVQCRGLKNCVPTDEVKKFIDLFVSKKLLTKTRTRVGVAV